MANPIRLILAFVVSALVLSGCAMPVYETPYQPPAPVDDRTQPAQQPALDGDTGERQPLMELPQRQTIVISIPDQRLVVVEEGRRIILDAPVSTGKPGHSTSTGTFEVGIKDIDHVSATYPVPKGGAPMPFAVNIAHKGGGYRLEWIHEGHLPGYPASHGCVRMEYPDAKQLYEIAMKRAPIHITPMQTHEFLAFLSGSNALKRR